MNARVKSGLTGFGRTIFSVFLALLIGSLFLLSIKASPTQVYSVMFQKAIKSFDLVLRRAMVLMLSGLAVSIPMKSGMFNIGGEHQIAAGALTAAIIGSLDIGLPPGIHMLVALLAAMLVGMLLSGFAAFLSIKRDVNEVITTIMLNNILAYIITWLVMNPFRGSEFSPQTKDILKSAAIPGFKNVSFSWGLFVAILICLLTWFFLERTPKGLELKASGLNPTAASYQGINISTMGMLGMLLGGAAAALGGGMEVLGGVGAYTDEYFAQYGFDGLAIAFMAGNNPIGIIFASIFMAMIRVGSLVVSRRTGVSTYFVSILQGLIITLLVAPAFASSIFNFTNRLKFRKAKKEASV